MCFQKSINSLHYLCFKETFLLSRAFYIALDENEYGVYSNFCSSPFFSKLLIVFYYLMQICWKSSFPPFFSSPSLIDYLNIFIHFSRLLPAGSVFYDHFIMTYFNHRISRQQYTLCLIAEKRGFACLVWKINELLGGNFQT